jgi:hypothetical protein
MRRAILAAAVVASSAFPPNLVGAAGGTTAITTSSKGTLTICRSWVVYRSCKSYDKLVLPARIAVGDKIKLTYSSNRKTYIFAVVEIRPKGEGCLLLSDQSGGEEDGERLDLERCLPASEAAAAQD